MRTVRVEELEERLRENVQRRCDPILGVLDLRLPKGLDCTRAWTDNSSERELLKAFKHFDTHQTGRICFRKTEY